MRPCSVYCGSYEKMPSDDAYAGGDPLSTQVAFEKVGTSMLVVAFLVTMMGVMEPAQSAPGICPAAKRIKMETVDRQWHRPVRQECMKCADEFDVSQVE